jgi:hypothetical protein
MIMLAPCLLCPIYHPQSTRLSQGAWEHGESFSQPSNQKSYSQVKDPTQGTRVNPEQCLHRQAKPQDAFTPLAYETRGRGRIKTSGRNWVLWLSLVIKVLDYL